MVLREYLIIFHCDERLLVSKKVISMVGLNVKLWSNVILVLPTVMIELSNIRKKNRVPLNVSNADK